MKPHYQKTSPNARLFDRHGTSAGIYPADVLFSPRFADDILVACARKGNNGVIVAESLVETLTAVASVSVHVESKINMPKAYLTLLQFP